MSVCPHPLIIKANRAHPYASAPLHRQYIKMLFMNPFYFIQRLNMLLFCCCYFKYRPDHLSCHVKHVHSSERPFKCQVTVSRYRQPHYYYICSCSCCSCCSCTDLFIVFAIGLQACTSAFATKDRLRSHMIRHEGKVTCSICGKMLSAAYITSHLKTHGQTNFNSCNKGMFRFSETHNMNNNMLRWCS